MQLSDTVTRKFIEILEVDDWEILTDKGFRPINSSNKTIEYQKYIITLSSGKRLECADTHIFFDANYVEVFAKDCFELHIQTEDGLELVTSVEKTDVFENMYDLSVKSEDHRYYTNGILSHNSTIMAAVFVHYVLFNDVKTCAILANKAATAREILGKVQLAYEHLPKWLQQGVLEWNKGSFLLENGSRVLASSTSSSAIRGFTINFLFIDEAAFIPTGIAEEFFTSVYPTISSGKTSKLVLISTPNGMNLFYKYYSEALAGTNGFLPIKAIWSDIPTRDQKWADEQLAVLGEQKFRQEMCCEFIGASSTLIDGQKLASIPVEVPIKHTETLKIYEEPVPGNVYVSIVDTARGTGGDYSAIVVINVSQLPYSIAAVYRDNKISTMLYPGLVFKLAAQYNDAAVLIETNDMGEQIANSLVYEYEYEHVIMSTGAVISSFGGKTPGLRTTKRTKALGCDALKVLVESDKLTIRDAQILYELANFVIKGASYAADVGNDDLAMCLVLFSYLTTQSAMQDLTSADARQKIILEKLKTTEEEMMPVGFFNDGTEVEKEAFYF